MIESFDSVPAYLKSVLESRKNMSIRALSRKLGYSSDRTVGMVLQGQREMGSEMQRRLAEFAKLGPRQREYLALLSERQKKNRLGQQTKKVDQQIQELKSKSVKAHRVDPVDMSGITSWFNYTIIEILSLAGKAMDPLSIQKRLRGHVDLADVERTLTALVQLNLIKRTPEGFFRVLAQNEFVETPPDVPSVTVRAIHRAQLQRASETLEEQAVDQREFIAKTLTVSASRIPAVKAKVRALMEELADQFMNDSADDAVVVQFNFQFYQQTSKK